jgi:hypothetical protein
MDWRLALAAAFAFASCAANAAETTPATMALARAALDSKGLETAAGRKTLGLAVRGYCDDVRRVYPQNSPQEDFWLDGEIRGSGERFSRVLASPEWGRRQAKLFTEGCAMWSAALEKGPDRSRYFVGLAYQFVRFATDAEFFAKKNGIDPGLLGIPPTLRFATEALLAAALNAEK